MAAEGRTRICSICGGSELAPGTVGYLQCLRCRHEIRRESDHQSTMVNEVLSRERVAKRDLKDRFQIAVTLGASRGRTRIIDVGAGSGRFLRHIRPQFEQHLGIEVTPDCVAFARNALELEIASALTAENVGVPDVVTFWHSLEHIPAFEQDAILSLLRSTLHAQSRVIVSVPNGLNAFKASSVYYDLQNHIHQFSPESLDALMSRHGFVPVGAHTALGYSLIGRSLSLVNLLSRKHNALYLELRRTGGRRSLSRQIMLLLGLAVAAVALIPALPGYLHDLFRPRRGIVLTFVYAKRPAES